VECVLAVEEAVLAVEEAVLAVEEVVVVVETPDLLQVAQIVMLASKLYQAGQDTLVEEANIFVQENTEIP